MDGFLPLQENREMYVRSYLKSACKVFDGGRITK